MEDCRPTAGFQPRLRAVWAYVRTYGGAMHLKPKACKHSGLRSPCAWCVCLVCLLCLARLVRLEHLRYVRTEPPGVAGVTQAPWYLHLRWAP